jgi:hypothetical protein
MVSIVPVKEWRNRSSGEATPARRHRIAMSDDGAQTQQASAVLARRHD